jgi:hypothetical protein
MRLRVAAMLLLVTTTLGAADEISAPSVSVQAVPRLPDGVESNDVTTAKIPFTLVVVNGSSRELSGLALVADLHSDFDVEATPRLAKLDPFSTFTSDFALVPRRKVDYGKYAVVFRVRYQWSIKGTVFTSVQPVTVTVELKRRFDKEAKAFPGGTASLFYLLLPVIVAFFTYQFVDRLRRGEGIQVPAFSGDYLLPAFGIGLLVNYFLSARYSWTKVLFAAAIAGVVWPALRWGWETFRQWRWGFDPDDEPKTYLRKVLHSPWTPHGDRWVTATAGGDTWSGVLLSQPDGSPVLGARVQVIVSDAQRRQTLEGLAKSTDRPSSRSLRRQLWQIVKRPEIEVGFEENALRGEEQIAACVVVDELVGFARQKSERKRFMEVTN